MFLACCIFTIAALVLPWYLPTYGGEYAGLQTIGYAGIGVALVVLVWILFIVWRYVL